MDQQLEHTFLRRTRILTQALIISGTLNIGLLCTFFYYSLQDEKNILEKDLPTHSVKQATQTNQDVFKAYCALSFEDLLLRLSNAEHVEEGVTKRDLALAALTTVHHLNVEKALGGTPYEKHLMLYRLAEGAQPTAVPLYLGLTHHQFEAIENYVREEKWPITAKGMFLHLKHASQNPDSSLLEAFYLTEPFDTIYQMLTKTGTNLSKEELVEVLTAGDPQSFELFGKNAQIDPDMKRSFLLKYALFGSKKAASLLLSSDAEFALKQIEDAPLIQLMEIASFDVPLITSFAKGVLKSLRPEPVRKKAASILYAHAKEPLPEPYDTSVALRRFFPEYFEQKERAATIATKKEVLPPPVKAMVTSPSPHFYVVQEGDSLWKIARRYKVGVEAIMKANGLDSEKLKPGRKLLIPESPKDKKPQGKGS